MTTTTSLRSFHNDPAIKDFYLARIRKNERGCVVWCTLHSDKRHAYVTRQFLLLLLTDPTHGVLQYVAAPQWTAQREAIERVATILQQPPETTTEAAAEAAWTAAWTAWAATEAASVAAWAVAWTATEAARAALWTARAASWTVADAARAAAWAAMAATEAAAEAAAWAAMAAAEAAWQWQRGILLDLLGAVPSALARREP